VIVRHDGETFGDLLREGRGGTSGLGHDRAVGIEFAHFTRNRQKLLVEFQAVARIDLPCQQAEHRVARRIPGGIAGATAFVAVFLAPAIFGRAERMVASKTG